MANIELPTDIWDIIVKQSIKTTPDIVNEMSFLELKELMKMYGMRYNQLCKETIQKLNIYDVILVNNRFYLVIKADASNEHITILGLYDKIEGGCYPTIFGNYQKSSDIKEKMFVGHVNSEIVIKSTLKQRKLQNIKIANGLKIGDVFISSIYTPREWVINHYRNEIFKNDINVVIGIEEKKIITLNYLDYKNIDGLVCYHPRLFKIDKSLVLMKLNYQDDPDIYIFIIKKTLMRSVLIQLKNNVDIL